MNRLNTRVILLAFFWINLSIGQTTFQKSFGGYNDDEGSCVKQTIDGGYIITGFTNSFGAGNHDLFLVKTDIYGDTLWTKTFGESLTDYGSSILQTFDGGYAVAGYKQTSGSSNRDMWLIKTDSNGDTLWTKTFTYSNINTDAAYSIQQTVDSGYVLVGSTSSLGVPADIFLLKIDKSGNLLWSKAYGGTNRDNALSVQQVNDMGFIITGRSNSFSSGDDDVYLIKTDSIGNLIWSTTFGGIYNESGQSVQQTIDGGYIVMGSTNSFGAQITDIYLIKTDSLGNPVWSKIMGGVGYEVGQTVQQTKDHGFVVCGTSGSFGASADVYLIKTDSLGNILWSKTFGGSTEDVGNDVQQTLDNGYIITGYTTSFSSGGNDIYLIKTDLNGNSGCTENVPLTSSTNVVSSLISPITNVAIGGTTTFVSTQSGKMSGTIIDICNSVGIKELHNDQKIILFPNPSSENFKIDLGHIYNKVEIEVTNLLGSIIHMEDYQNTSSINIEIKGNRGIYFIKIRKDNQTEQVLKLIKE